MSCRISNVGDDRTVSCSSWGGRNMRAIALALGVTLLPAAAFAQDAAAPVADAGPGVSGYRIAVIAAGTVAGVIAANAPTRGAVPPHPPFCPPPAGGPAPAPGPPPGGAHTCP